MPTLVTFNGTNYNIPLPGETGWGDQVNAFLVAVSSSALVSGSAPASLTITTLNTQEETLANASTVVAAGGTITPSNSNIIISALSAVTLSAVTSILSGTTDGQLLILQCSGTFPVTIQDGSNTSMNGDVILAPGESIEFKWDSVLFWVEQRRSA